MAKKTKVVEVKDVKPIVEKKGAYHVFIKLNDRAYEVDTDNLVETILSFKPVILKTSLTLKITKGNKTIDRYLYLKEGRRLFTNNLTLEVFVRNLFF